MAELWDLLRMYTMYAFNPIEFWDEVWNHAWFNVYETAQKEGLAGVLSWPYLKMILPTIVGAFFVHGQEKHQGKIFIASWVISYLIIMFLILPGTIYLLLLYSCDNNQVYDSVVKQCVEEFHFP